MLPTVCPGYTGEHLQEHVREFVGRGHQCAHSVLTLPLGEAAS